MERILDRIGSPKDLKKLSEADLLVLCQELRDQIIETVTKTGGHLGASLGAVELTVAIHRVFDAPTDRIVWDVGHQAYGHKLLTGRRERFGTIRQYGGLSGFPVRAESEYDTFGVAHAGTSISAGLGMATALAAQEKDARVLCVIGDGGLTCGMAFEALNQAGHLRKNLIVVLNDNEWSISKNVGALSTYLTRLTSRPLYRRFEADIWELLGKIPRAGGKAQELAHRIKESLKGLVVPGVMFEELGFKYFGPIDGHNLHEVVATLTALKALEGPVFLHVVTEKGKGYPFAPTSKTRAHGVAPPEAAKKAPAYTNVFGKTMIELAERDPKIIAITAAMPDGTGTSEFGERFPDLFFDVGIAEQHAVTFAAGLACEGMKPFCAIYSTFLQRAYDQVVHDVALQKLPVRFVMDRAGLVGDDGPTHHGVFDVGYLRILPNFVVMAPKDENELRHMLYTMAEYGDGPIAMRYPRGAGVGVTMDAELKKIPIGRAETIREGDDVAIVALGSMVQPALAAAEDLFARGVDAAVVNARFVKPLDESLLLSIVRHTGLVITVEESQRAGGFGSAVGELFADRGVEARLVSIALPDAFVEHGTPAILRSNVALTAEAIEKRVLAALPRPTPRAAETSASA